MSDASTRRMLAAFEQQAPAPLFLSSFFKTSPNSFHTSEKVEIDIIREDEDVAVPLPDLTTGARNNENTKMVNKEFTPTILREKSAIVAYEQIKRQPGADPFEDPNFLSNAARQILGIMRKLGNKLKRTVELMAAQILQTGVITLIDENGVTIYTEDFLVKATHLITVGTVWATDGTTGDPLADVSAAARVIRKDGKRRPDRLLFGNSALQRFLANAKVKAALDKTTLNLAVLNPSNRSEDATFVGMIWIDNYQYEIWLYDGWYKHPQTGTMTPYIADDKLIILSSPARFDLTFGAIPFMASPDARAQQLVSGRMSSVDGRFDFTPNAYVSEDNVRLVLELGTRPLPVPVEPDSYACIDCVP
jgi:hypothetical protein